MIFTASVRVQRGAFSLAADVSVEPGEVLALVGPNGAGKTTLLRSVAGLEPLTSGTVALGGAVLEDPARRIRVPVERRPFGYVFQDYRLFPHLTALDNAAFGLRCRGVRRAAARLQAGEWLDRLGLADRAGHKPAALSGGQAQRVALARALAIRPDVLLLDEPLAALDAALRPTLRTELRRVVADYDGRCLLVTHDPLDALVLADRIAVLDAGRIVQTGTPGEVARRPRTDHVARLVGLNLYRGAASGTTVRLADGGELATAEPVDGPAFAAFPPTAVALYRARPDGSPRNTWPCTVAGLEPYGGTIRVRLTGAPDVQADVTAAAVADLRLAPGEQVWASVKAVEVACYPA